MVLTDIWNCHVYNVHKNYDSVDNISDNDNTVLYEVPTDLEMINGLFRDEITEEQNVKFKLIPVYHQALRVSTSTYYSNRITKKDIGIPLVIKLPVEHVIETSLVDAYITKMMTPYLQNIEKWDPTQHVMPGIEVHSTNIASLSDPDDQPTEAAENLFGHDEHSSAEGDGPIEEEPAIEIQPGTGEAAVSDEEDQEPELPEEREEEEERKEDEMEESKHEEDSKEDATPSMPYCFVVVDKYGKNCGECSYASNCDGCPLDALMDGKIRIPDNDYDSRAIAIRWKLGAQKCFNHNAFMVPLQDASVPAEGTQTKDYSFTPKETVDLSQCIEEFVAEETLGKNDMWYCRACKDHKCAMKKLDLYSLPSICIIHLKRFTQNGYYREKNDASVKYPINGLDLSKWLSPRKEEVNALYDLFAVSIHSGGLGGGHYIANAKNLHNGDWYDYNDSSCSSMNEESACTDSAYVLFYKKRGDQSMEAIKDLVSPADSNEALDAIAEQQSVE